MEQQLGFRQGVMDGLPIGLGYLSVSFTFGIMAIIAGLYWWEAVLISMSCVTSVEMLVSQLTINVRYSFMSISLSQKVTERFSGIWRWIFGFMITDEIFAVAVSKPVVRRKYFAGLMVMPYVGWTGGTLAGALLGDVLPASVMSALGIAIYAMFVAIVVPEMKKRLAVVYVVILAAGLSCAFTYVPGLNKVPAGIAISICAVVAAFVMAVVKPLTDVEMAQMDVQEANASVGEDDKERRGGVSHES